MPSSLSMPPRSASCFVAKPARGFQLLRIDGYSCTKDLPAGERVTSDVFTVGGRHWCVDYYPNGASADDESSGAIALYLRLVGGVSYNYYHHVHQTNKDRIRARYKFSLLDLATGDAAYELPEETAVFTVAAGSGQAAAPSGAGTRNSSRGRSWRASSGRTASPSAATSASPRWRRCRPPPTPRWWRGSWPATLLPGIAGITSIATSATTTRELYYGGMDGWREGISRRNHQEPPPDDKEFIRRCLAGERPRE
ncbi:unnamed protein product [Urochloa humidicola]